MSKHDSGLCILVAVESRDNGCGEGGIELMMVACGADGPDKVADMEEQLVIGEGASIRQHGSWRN